MKISIIIPVYNTELYIAQCLDSLLEQTFSDYEIICIDDGSTDNSINILNSYHEKNENITVLRQQNLYAGVARNNGLRIAKGEYVVFFDSDDFVTPDFLSELYQGITSADADICLCKGRIFDMNTNSYRPWNTINYSKTPELQVFNRDDLGVNAFTFIIPTPCCKIIKKSLLEKYNIEFQNLHSSNDVFFSMYSNFMASKITIIKKELYLYRRGLTTNLQSNKNISPLDSAHAYELLFSKLEMSCYFSPIFRVSLSTYFINHYKWYLNQQ